ncbi:MAG: ferredoxin--NADP reductase [Deltaproteobacteria bacterium]|nr:ferredoxin--NADP reductase [Deltaproteobacteria bacterium]
MTPALDARVVDVRRDVPYLAVLRIAHDAGPLTFIPGQFVNLGLPAADGTMVKRPYSVTSAPGDAVAEFAITRVDGGVLSPRLCALSAGDRVHLEQVGAGSFTLRDVPPGMPLLLVATGTGTAPLVSQLRAGQCPGRAVTVVHGGRTAGGLAYRELLAGWPGLTYLPTTTRDPAWTGRTGRVTALLEELGPVPGSVFALVCGNPGMIAEVRRWLEARGFRKHRKREPGHFLAEPYWGAAVSPSS